MKYCPWGLSFFHGFGHGHGDAAQRGVDMAPLVRCSALFQITWDISSGRSENRSPVDPRARVQIARYGPASIWTAAISFAIIWTFVRDYLDTP